MRHKIFNNTVESNNKRRWLRKFGWLKKIFYSFRLDRSTPNIAGHLVSYSDWPDGDSLFGACGAEFRTERVIKDLSWIGCARWFQSWRKEALSNEPGARLRCSSRRRDKHDQSTRRAASGVLQTARSSKQSSIRKETRERERERERIRVSCLYLSLPLAPKYPFRSFAFVSLFFLAWYDEAPRLMKPQWHNIMRSSWCNNHMPSYRLIRY